MWVASGVGEQQTSKQCDCATTRQDEGDPGGGEILRHYSRHGGFSRAARPIVAEWRQSMQKGRRESGEPTMRLGRSRFATEPLGRGKYGLPDWGEGEGADDERAER